VRCVTGCEAPNIEHPYQSRLPACVAGRLPVLCFLPMGEEEVYPNRWVTGLAVIHPSLRLYGNTAIWRGMHEVLQRKAAHLFAIGARQEQAT
jgi:hypothetical protein